MLYGMFRLGIGFIIAIVLFVLIKYTKTIDKRKCCIAAFIAVSITVSLLYLIPFENAFILPFLLLRKHFTIQTLGI